MNTRQLFPTFKSTFALAFLFLSCGLSLGQPAITIAPDELRLDGNVQSYDATQGQLVLNAVSFTLPSGNTHNINPAKSKTIIINSQTTFQDVTGKSIPKPFLKNGTSLSVIGSDNGNGKTLVARLIIVSNAVIAQTPATHDDLRKFQIVGSATIHPEIAQLLTKGSDAFHSGNFADALQWDKSASQLAIEQGDSMGNALSQNALGFVYDAMHQFPLAEAAFQSSIKISQSMGDQASAAIAMSNLGGHYALNHDAARSAKSYETALTMIPSDDFSGKENLKLSIDYNCAFAYLVTDQKDKAIQSMQMAVDISRELKDIYYQTQSTLHLADFQVRDKRYKDALVDAKPMNDLIPQLADKEDQASSWAALYAILKLCNDDQAAERAYSKAEQLYTELNDQDKLDTLKSEKVTLDLSAELQREIDKGNELLKKNDEIMKAMKKSIDKEQTPKQ